MKIAFIPKIFKRLYFPPPLLSSCNQLLEKMIEDKFKAYGSSIG